MTQPRSLSLHELPPFVGFTAEGLNALVSGSEVLSYTVGQPLATSQDLPDKVLVILEGQARLLGHDGKRTYTVGKLSGGAIVGLVSLLRASPCEEVSAATELKVLAIADERMLEAYRNENSFRIWCNSTLQAAEVQDLAKCLLEKSTRSDLDPKGVLQQLLQQSELRVVDSKGQVPPAREGYIWLLGSANVEEHSKGIQIEDGETLVCREPFPARLIGVPTTLHHQIMRDGSSHIVPKTAAVQIGGVLAETKVDVKQAPPQPGISGANVGQYAEKQRFELIRAEGAREETQACLQMLAAELCLPFRKDSVEKMLRDALRHDKPPTLELCGGLMAMLGLHAYGAKVPSRMGIRLQVPALIPWKGSFALVKHSNARGLQLASPRDGWVEVKPDQLEDQFPEGIDILMVDRNNATPEQKFGIGWFWPALKKYRGVLLQVLLAGFVVQLFGLASPLLIQVIIDKVISQRSLETLQVLGIALVVVTVLGGVLGSLQTFLFSETTNRIDTRLGAEVIDHLLRLPLNYFDRRPVGELSSRIGELEKIRSFLTGQALTTILDAAFSVIYIVVMLLYSWILTLIALAVVPIQVALTIIGAPLIRRQIRETAEKNAKTQSHLVEVLTGIQTVKAQNVETVSRWKWQDLYNKYISRTFDKTITGTVLNQTSNVLQQLSQLLVLWVGAEQVLAGQLSLGQLIAFRIISGYVTQPLLRLSNIWQSVQELRVSFERLADIIDTPEESSDLDKANIPLPVIEGHVRFEELSFSFKPGSQKILDRISLDISAGKFVGIVGQSGSGKSTLMKLLPRLYEPQEGKILIDNYDISKVELYSLRRQIGIVPQDPLLFAGSVSDNVALTDPDADSDDIVKACQIAEAHSFIMALPSGYSTDVGERGASLSGGQRQRLAIARTLLSKPKLLILDEATSALDYDTERRVCDNLREACRGSTVFFITHRLSTIRNADMVVMLDKGVIAELGTHDELMALRGRYYALYRQQESS